MAEQSPSARAPLNVGVIGAGWFASRRHLPDLQANPDARIAVLCRRSEPELRKLADHFGIERVYTDYRALLQQEDLDAVLVASPHGLHHEHVRAALERGLHVLVEKPLAVTTQQATELVQLARERGLLLSTAVNPPYWPHCCYLRSRIASGDLGEIEAVELSMIGSAEHVFGRAPMPANLPGVVPPTLFRGDPALCGGGNLADSGAHLVSELLWVVGKPAASVSAWMDDASADIRALVTIALAGGPTGTVNAIANSRYPERRVHNVYYGSAATATVDGLPFRLTLTRPGSDPEVLLERDLPPVPSPVANFIDAILNRAPLAAAPEHGAEVTAVLEAAYRSAQTGRRVDLATL
jgi:predicted dehydrogenase